jgi:hypothetical protein
MKGLCIHPLDSGGLASIFYYYLGIDRTKRPLSATARLLRIINKQNGALRAPPSIAASVLAALCSVSLGSFFHAKRGAARPPQAYMHTYGTTKIYQNVRSFGLAVTPHSTHYNVTISATKPYVFKGTKRALER